MFSIIDTVTVFWLVRTIKIVLFWVYLWQLKEYHIGRFLDHFRTEKGEKLVFNAQVGVKLLLLAGVFSNYHASIFLGALLLIYVAEIFIFILNIVKKNLKKPTPTAKTMFLVLVSFIVIVICLAIIYGLVSSIGQFVAAILIFDIIIPVIVSAIVLLFQPFFVLIRNRVLNMAKKKMEGMKNLTVIGITGSYGKTSTKEFLSTILSEKFSVLATPEHKNSEIGIAETILRELSEKYEIFIAEMGAYGKGGINLLCDITKPKIGIVTGVNEQHLALFGTMDNLLSAEGGRELAENLPKDGLLILNGDNKYSLDLYKKARVKTKTYNIKKDATETDIWTEDVEIKKDSVSFIAALKSGEMANFNVNVLGKHNIQNLLAAILATKELGMKIEEIAAGCGKIKPEQSGAILKQGIHGINIIDSSYSSNPDGVMAELDYLAIFPQKRVIVMPCLIELGKKSSETHEKIGKKIAEVCDMAIITTQDKFENIKNGAVQNEMLSDKIIFSENPKEIFNLITTFCKENDTLLLEGRVPSELVKLLNAE